MNLHWHTHPRSPPFPLSHTAQHFSSFPQSQCNALDSQHLSCWLCYHCCLHHPLPGIHNICSVHEILSICHAGSWIPAVCLYTALTSRFTASVMLAHESPPPVAIQPCPRDSQHLSCWLMNLCSLSLLPYPQDSQHLSCWLMNLFCYPCTVLTPRFTASVMLAHESLLLSLHCSNPEIHSICHAGPRISAASVYCPVHEIHSICHAGSWISTTFIALFLTPRFTASVLLAHESLPPLLYGPVHEINSICHAGSWISTTILAVFCV
jgi:hypothetical protein